MVEELKLKWQVSQLVFQYLSHNRELYLAQSNFALGVWCNLYLYVIFRKWKYINLIYLIIKHLSPYHYSAQATIHWKQTALHLEYYHVPETFIVHKHIPCEHQILCRMFGHRTWYRLSLGCRSRHTPLLTSLSHTSHSCDLIGICCHDPCLCT